MRRDEAASVSAWVFRLERLQVAASDAGGDMVELRWAGLRPARRAFRGSSTATRSTGLGSGQASPAADPDPPCRADRDDRRAIATGPDEGNGSVPPTTSVG